MSDPNILLIFAQAIAALLNCEVRKLRPWQGGIKSADEYYIGISERYSIWLNDDDVNIEILDCDCDLEEYAYQFNLADPDVSPKIVAAKVVELMRAEGRKNE